MSKKFTSNRQIYNYKAAKKRRIDQINQNLRNGIVHEGIDKQYLLNKIKYSLTEKETDTVLEKLDDETFQYVISNPIVFNYSNISKSQEYNKESDLKKEFNWIFRFLKDYSEEINEFLQIEERYEVCLLLGKYEKALEYIQEIESKISLSIWGIQQRLFIAELDKGFKANKDVLSNFLSEENSTLVNFIVNYTSIRIEKNISPSQYTEFVNEYIKAINTPSINNYIFFKIDFLKNFEYENYPQPLLFDGTLPIIDRYKTFLQYSQIILSDSKSTDQTKLHVKNLLKNLVNVITDIDLELLNALSEGEIATIDNNFVKILDFYTSENYSQSYLSAREYITKNPRCFHSISIYVKSLANLNKEHLPFNQNGSVVDNIIELLLLITVKGDDFVESSYYDLYKIAHFFGNHPLAIGILNFLSEEMVYQFPQISKINLDKYSTLNSKVVNPSLFSYVSQRFQKKFVNNIEKNEKNEKSATINLIRQVSLIDKKTTINYDEYNLRTLKYFGIKLRNLGAFDDALLIFDYIISSDRFSDNLNIKHIRTEILFEKYTCLINLNKNKKALDLATKNLIEDKNLLEKFFHPVLLNRLITTEQEDLISNINLPIFLKFYEYHVDVYNIYVAYDNFLCFNECETPNDFFKKFDSKIIEHVVFLDKVCRHEILHSSPFYKDQEELDLARIEICNFLSSKIDGYGNLETEISDLFRKVLVRKGIKQIDYSKIYVDVKGLKTTLTKELKDSFNRNIEIASLPVDQLNKIVDSIGNLLVYYVEHDDNSKIDDPDELLNKVKLTSYNRFIHFMEAFLKIRDKFLMSPDHGLDTYLSMRIRHGTLPGQIRSVFESHKLITSWSESDGKYLQNDFWLNKLSFLNEDYRIRISKAFDKFSKSIDDLAEKLKSQTIQIKTETTKGNSGLFDYSYSESALLELFSKRFGSIKDFEMFFNEVIEVLWDKTEECLSVSRNYLNKQFVIEIKKGFTELDSTIQQIHVFNFGQNQELKDLQATVKDCETAIVVEIQKISEWFRKSNKKFIEEFDFSILLDSSVNTLKRSFQNATITIENNSTIKLDGDLFPYFTDILFYLLHNPIKHSKLPLEELNINILISQDEKYITLEITNNLLNEESYLQILSDEIENTRKKLKDPRPYERINREGGTGFPKIKKALSHDLSRKDYSIELSLSKNEVDALFNVLISFEYLDLPKPLTL